MKTKNNYGFTIVEVMITMGVLLICYIVIFGIYKISQQYTKEAELQIESIIKSESLVKGLVRKIETTFPLSVQIKKNSVTNVSGDEIIVDNFRYYLYPDPTTINTTDYILYYQPDYFNNPNFIVPIAYGISKSKDKDGNDIDPFTVIPVPKENKVVVDNRVKWVNLSDLPFERAFMSVLVNADQIYCIGGLGSIGAINEIIRYDTTINTWNNTVVGSTDPLDFMPTPLYHMASCEKDGSIYFFGGTIDGSTPTNIVMSYNPSTNVWYTDTNNGGSLQPLPKPVKGAGCVYLEIIDPATLERKPRMYIFGGTIDGSTQIYDPVQNAWLTEGIPMSFDNNVSQIQAIQVYNYMVIFSGNKNDSAFSKIQYYKPEYNSALDTWAPLDAQNWPFTNTIWEGATMTSLPNNTARWNYAAINVNDKLYILGGNNHLSKINIFHFYQEKINNDFLWKNRWITIPNKAFDSNNEFISREGANIGYYQGKIYVIGGRDGTNYLRTVQVYDVGTKKTIQINFKIKKWEKRIINQPYDVEKKVFRQMDVLINISTSN